MEDDDEHNALLDWTGGEQPSGRTVEGRFFSNFCKRMRSCSGASVSSVSSQDGTGDGFGGISQGFEVTGKACGPYSQLQAAAASPDTALKLRMMKPKRRHFCTGS